MDGKLAGEGVTHFVSCAAEGCVKSLVVVADAVVGKHQVDGLLGADSEITTEARLKVEAVSHLDFVGTKTDVGSQIYGKEGRNLGRREVGLQTTKDLDVVANIIAGAVVGVTSAAVVLVAGVVKAIEVLVARTCADEEVVVDAVATDEVHTEGELLVLVKADATGGLDGLLKARILGKCGDGCHSDDGAEDEFSHCR